MAERAGWLVLKALEQAGGLEAPAAAHEAVSAHHGNNYLPLLKAHYRSHRSALFTLVESIDLESTNADRNVLDAVEYLKAQRNARAVFVPERITVEQQAPDGTTAALTLSVDAFGGVAGVDQGAARGLGRVLFNLVEVQHRLRGHSQAPAVFEPLAHRALGDQAGQLGLQGGVVLVPGTAIGEPRVRGEIRPSDGTEEVGLVLVGVGHDADPPVRGLMRPPL